MANEQNNICLNDLVRMFTDEETFIQNWKNLYSLISIRHSSLDSYVSTKLKQKGVDIQKLLFKILEAWALNSPRDATIQQLVKILRRANFATFAGQIETRLSNIQTPPDDGEAPNLVFVVLDGRKFTHSASRRWMMCLVIVVVIFFLIFGIIVGFIFLKESESNYTMKQLINTSHEHNSTFPRWYQIQRPPINFKGRVLELKAMTNLFKQQNQTGNLSYVLITGSTGIGKSVLARYFAYKLYTESKVNCFWINGSNLKPEIEFFLTKIFNVSLNIMLKSTHSVISNNRFHPWVIIFDGINTPESINHLNILLENFSRNTQNNNPIVIVTTTNNQIASVLYVKNNVTLNVSLVTYESLSNIFQNDVTPDILLLLPVQSLNYKLVCYKINRVFENLDQIEGASDIKIKASFSFMAMLSYFLEGSIDKSFVMRYWSLSLNETIEAEFLLKIFNLFLDAEIVIKTFNDTVNVQNYQSFSADISTVLSKFYFLHPWIKSEFGKELSLELTEITVIRWQFHTVILYLKSYSHIDETPQLSTLLRHVLNQDILVVEFKNEIQELEIYFKLSTLSLAFVKYFNIFGGKDLLTLRIGEKLAETFFKCKMYEESGETYEKLYNLKKETFGSVDLRTLYDGERAIKSYYLEGLYEKAAGIALDMSNNSPTFGITTTVKREINPP